jgi:hypothetical protein
MVKSQSRLFPVVPSLKTLHTIIQLFHNHPLSITDPLPETTSPFLHPQPQIAHPLHLTPNHTRSLSAEIHYLQHQYPAAPTP